MDKDKLLDLTRDFDAAKAAFEAYLDEYDRADDKIHLKIVHTYGAVSYTHLDVYKRQQLSRDRTEAVYVSASSYFFIFIKYMTDMM